MKPKTDRDRVQFVLGLYLFLFLLLNTAVWTWFVVHRHGPHRFPLGERVERFGDLLRFARKPQVWQDPRLEDLGSHLRGSLFPRNYPPLASAIYVFLLQECAPYTVPIFFAIVLSSVTAAAFFLWRRLKNFPSYRWFIGAAVFATALLGWGTETTLMRGNIEGIMWIAVWLGACGFALKRYNSAGVAFGIASCIKPYPVLWLALMGRHKHFRGTVVGLLSAVVVTLCSLMVFSFNPVTAFRILATPPAGVPPGTFFDMYIASFRPMDEMMLDHSLFQTIKTTARVVRDGTIWLPHDEFRLHAADPLALKLYHAYVVIAAILGLVVVVRCWKLPVINQVFAVANVMTLLPLISGDYTLTVLLIPMGFFLIYLLQDVAQSTVRLSTFAMLSYLLPSVWIMAITPMWVLHGVLKCVAVLWLLVSTLSIPLPSTLFGEVDPTRAAGAETREISAQV